MNKKSFSPIIKCPPTDSSQKCVTNQSVGAGETAILYGSVQGGGAADAALVFQALVEGLQVALAGLVKKERGSRYDSD